MEETITLSRIAGTLKYGEFDGKHRIAGLLSCSIFAVVFYSGIIAAITYFSIAQAKEPDPVPQFVGIILGFLLTSAFPSVFIVLVAKNEHQRKAILLWLEDAVELKGGIRQIGECETDCFPNAVRHVKIEVRFKFEGKRHKRTSENKEFGGELPRGYDKFWTKYADCEVSLLYSPKYDQVMILKD